MTRQPSRREQQIARDHMATTANLLEIRRLELEAAEAADRRRTLNNTLMTVAANRSERQTLRDIDVTRLSEQGVSS